MLGVCRLLRGVSLMVTLLLPALSAPSVTLGAQGDCGQPVSAGTTPTATDALVVLRVAVHLSSCDLCVCDTDNSGAVTATDALAVLQRSVGAAVTLTCSGCPVEVFPGIETPVDGFLVELKWNTPGDPDQTDVGPEAGSDMDLHVTHPAAARNDDIDQDGQPDPWFDQLYDVFWFDVNPAWGMAPDQNPRLDRDDSDGAGPEIVTLARPVDGMSYRVGVHYWKDHFYGTSEATLRVYVRTKLVYEDTAGPMSWLDMWDALTISWPDGAVVPVRIAGGLRKITPNYQNPAFFQPTR